MKKILSSAAIVAPLVAFSGGAQAAVVFVSTSVTDVGNVSANYNGTSSAAKSGGYNSTLIDASQSDVLTNGNDLSKTKTVTSGAIATTHATASASIDSNLTLNSVSSGVFEISGSESVGTGTNASTTKATASADTYGSGTYTFTVTGNTVLTFTDSNTTTGAIASYLDAFGIYSGTGTLGPQLLGVTFNGNTSSNPQTFDLAAGTYTIDFSDVVGGLSVTGRSKSLAGTFDSTLGFSLASAVPEASTWLMMMAGFLGLGFVGFGRQRKDRLAD